MSKIELSKITIDKITEGYLWLSNSPDPIVDLTAIQEQLSQTDDSSNPFIIEGQLYGEKDKISYSIKYVDGKHHVVEYRLGELGEDYDPPKIFVANRIPNKTHIYFRQYWKESVEESMSGMKVLRPDAFVFVGFDKKEKED